LFFSAQFKLICCLGQEWVFVDGSDGCGAKRNLVGQQHDFPFVHCIPDQQAPPISLGLDASVRYSRDIMATIEPGLSVKASAILTSLRLGSVIST